MTEIEVKTFGQRLKAARQAAGMSQQKLCESAGLAERTLRDIETGKSDPGLSLAIALARAVGIPVEVPGE